MKTLRVLLVMAMLTQMCAGAEGRQTTPAIDPATGLPILEPKPVEPVLDVEFLGGYPDDLVKAMEAGLKKSLNVIIPPQYRHEELPPLSMRKVTVPQLFDALVVANTKLENRITGYDAKNRAIYAPVTTTFGFRTIDSTPSVNSIWHYFHDSPPAIPEEVAMKPQPQCRFWQLEPFLAKFQVEDITTAIETGWRMINATPGPKLSFHKETKLLIVVGQHDHLVLVDEVLAQLTASKRGEKDKSGNAPEKPSRN